MVEDNYMDKGENFGAAGYILVFFVVVVVRVLLFGFSLGA